MPKTQLSRQESKSFYKTLFALVLPMTLQNLINVAVTSADVVMLGSLGEITLSGVSLANQVYFILTMFIFGLTSGASILTAQYWGKHESRTIEKILGIALRFALIVGILFTVAATIFPEFVMRIFTPEQPVIDEGVRYLRIVGISYLLTCISMTYLNIMRSVERVIIATVVYSISLVINIIINSILIFGLFGAPEMGIAGAAVGTLIAKIFELVVTLVYSQKNKVVRLHISDIFGRNRVLLKDFIKFSIPTTLNELLWGCGMSVIAIIIGHMGSSVVAANSVAQVVRQLATVVSFGIAAATAIVLGKTLGNGEIEKARLQSHKLIKVTLVSGALGSAIVLAIRPLILKSFSLSPESLGYLSLMLIVMSYFVFCQAISCTFIVGIFRAGGDSKFGLICDIVSMWTISIVFGALAAFVFKWSVPVVYIILTSDELIKIPLAIWRYKKMIWLKNITR